VDGEIVVLQRELHAPERRWFAAPGPSSLLEVARCIAGLDLVITVDTSTAHLAGALGRPVWTLIPFAPDWRWLLGCEDSPWYPSMRLFRQRVARDWRDVVARVAAELARLTS
jgi:ADP-heptose:LPS heptosyltransferase